jgi:hypothetical protein
VSVITVKRGVGFGVSKRASNTATNAFVLGVGSILTQITRLVGLQEGDTSYHRSAVTSVVSNTPGFLGRFLPPLQIDKSIRI